LPNGAPPDREKVTMGGYLKARTVTEVTTPQVLPPPPRKAQKRSVFWLLTIDGKSANYDESLGLGMIIK